MAADPEAENAKAVRGEALTELVNSPGWGLLRDVLVKRCAECRAVVLGRTPPSENDRAFALGQLWSMYSFLHDAYKASLEGRIPDWVEALVK